MSDDLAARVRLLEAQVAQLYAKLAAHEVAEREALQILSELRLALEANTPRR